MSENRAVKLKDKIKRFGDSLKNEGYEVSEWRAEIYHLELLLELLSDLNERNQHLEERLKTLEGRTQFFPPRQSI